MSVIAFPLGLGLDEKLRGIFGDGWGARAVIAAYASLFLVVMGTRFVRLPRAILRVSVRASVLLYDLLFLPAVKQQRE